MTPRSPDGERATTAVVGAVLLVGLTVALATVVGGAIASAPTTGPTPTVARSTGVFETGPSVGCTDNVVEIIHEGGDPIPPEDIAVVVHLPDSGATARLTGLPLTGSQFDPANLAGDGHVVYDNCVGGVVADGGRQWVSGTAIKFELNAGGGTVSVGDRIVVRVVHEPTESVVVEATLTAR